MIDIAVKNVLRQRVRSLLTVLGIALGIGLIIMLGSIGEGLTKQMSDSLGDVAAVIDVRATNNEDGITDDIIQGISELQGVKQVIPVGSYSISRSMGGFGGRMRNIFGGGGGSSKVNIQFTAIYPDDLEYLVDETIIAREGRKIDDADSGQMVVLMGSNAAESNGYNLGDEIVYQRRVRENDTTEEYYFEIVGILEEIGDTNVDDQTYVSLTTMQEIEDDETIDSLKVQLDDVELVEDMTKEIDDYSDEIRAMSMLTMVRQIESTLATVQMAVYGIGAISLIVGGIGVMNTMIMSVMERRREIGIMKAIGATTKDILTQVLEESAILSLFGGIAGLGMGYFSMMLVENYSTFKPILSMELVGIAIGFSLFLGMGAGLYPAYAASQLDPIEVLRYE